LSKIIEKIANGTKFNKESENEAYKTFINEFLEKYDKISLEFIDNIIDVDDPDINYSSKTTVNKKLK
jgi:recombinational DNA repair protein RecT